MTASFAEAVARVESDATRTFSRDLDFLRRHYDMAKADLRALPSTELVLDADATSPDQAASSIATLALELPIA